MLLCTCAGTHICGFQTKLNPNAEQMLNSNIAMQLFSTFGLMMDETRQSFPQWLSTVRFVAASAFERQYFRACYSDMPLHPQNRNLI